MENFSSMIQLIAAFISTVFLPLLLIKAQRRKANAEADQAEASNIVSVAEEWKELYDKKDQTVAEKDKKIDSLYDEITELRNQKTALQEHVSQLKIENTALLFRKCDKHGCPDRRPPSDF